MLKTIDLNKKKPTLQFKLAEGTRSRRSHNRGLVEVERAGSMPRRNDLTPTLKLETRAVGDVRPAKRRLHKDEPGHLAEVMRSITAFGQVVPILIKADGEIIDGAALHSLKDIRHTKDGRYRSPLTPRAFDGRFVCHLDSAELLITPNYPSQARLVSITGDYRIDFDVAETCRRIAFDPIPRTSSRFE